MTVVQWIGRMDDAAPADLAAPAAPSFDALFRSHHSRLVRSVTVICGDPDVAADCVADAFERAYVRWRKVGRLEDPAGWVRRVAINRATDIARRRTRGGRALQRLAVRTDAVVADVEPSDRSIFTDHGIGAALNALSPQQRAVVALHYLDDLPVTEVAAALNLSEGTVKYHLHQARGHLRTILTDSPDEPPTAPRTDS